MRLDIGTTIISTAGTEVRLSTDGGISATDRILSAMFSPREGNTGKVYVGIADVTSSHGKEMGMGFSINPGALGGTVPAGDIYFDAANSSDRVDWVIFIED